MDPLRRLSKLRQGVQLFPGRYPLGVTPLPRYECARADYMLQTNQGLTQTYNLLKDPDCTDPPILDLRSLHEEMDAAVLTAYGWTNIAVPPYCPTTPAEHKALETFQDEVIDRLFVLNAERAQDERRRGLGGDRRRQPSKTDSVASSPQAELELD